MSSWASSTAQTACETVLLSHLGNELAQIYRDTLRTPIPSALQVLVDRLDNVCDSTGSAPDEAFPSQS